MTKLLLLISALLMAAGIFVSFQNRQAFVEARADRTKNDNQINTERKSVEKAASEVAELKGNILAANNDLSQEQERLAQANIKKANATKDAEADTAEFAKTKEEIDKIKADAEKLPAGVTIETINDDINKLKQTIADNEGKVEKIKEDSSTKEKEVKKAEEELVEQEKRIEERKKLFERNRLTATIVAVNNDWGFVVIEGGTNKNISADTKLLVTRGNDAIGKLNIVAVQPNKTLANIVLKSVRPGVSIAPGDKVILETLYQ